MARFLLAAFALASLSLAETRPGIGMEFVKIAPGEFMMGCSVGDIDCNDDERPAHRVQITKPFEIGKYEVTQAQWQAVMDSNPSTMKGDDRPVETISKTEAEEFLNKLNALNDGYHYRLPSEAEWEYAARAGSADPYSKPLDEIAWYTGNSEDETHPVGKKKPNAWGLYDMQGNVREYVEDWYGRDYYRNSPAADPTGPTIVQQGFPGGRRGGPRGFGGGGGGRGGPVDPGGPGIPDGQGGRRGRGGGGRGQLPVMRGGAWDNPAPFLRISARYSYYGPTLRVSDVGFRVVRETVSR
jgi:formylglycine-generating enzyme required for sulfatase activity